MTETEPATRRDLERIVADAIVTWRLGQLTETDTGRQVDMFGVSQIIVSRIMDRLSLVEARTP